MTDKQTGEARMDQVGFIGAGNIGAPMARTLLRGQLELKLCDFNETVRRQFEDLGCETTDKASDLGRCGAIVIMVNTADQLKAALFGQNGLVAGLTESIRPLVIVTSTIFPAIIAKISRMLASHRLAMIDAPVSGGPIPRRRVSSPSWSAASRRTSRRRCPS